MNVKRTETAPIRLPVQAEIPTQRQVIDMSAESKRSKKRIELPLHPKGRPEPAALSVQFDELTGKSSWMLYDGMRDDAEMVWAAADPEPSKVVQSMRDWAMTARHLEGWGSAAAGSADSGAGGTQAAEASTPPSAPPTPEQTFPTLSQALQQPPAADYLSAAAQQPQAPMAAPAAGGVYGMPEEPAPPHWVHAYPTPQGPLPPELWTTQPLAVRPTMMLGDALVAAGIIPTRTLHAALTLQLAMQTDKRRIGEILVNSGAVQQSMIQAAVRLQEMARSGEITEARVTDCLRRMHAAGESLETALSQTVPQAQSVAMPPPATPKHPKMRRTQDILDKQPDVSEDDQKKLKNVLSLVKQVDFEGQQGAERCTALLDLFKAAMLIDDKFVESASTSGKSPADIAKSLLVKELVDPVTFSAGLDCHRLMAVRRLRPDQAIIALGYCQRSRVSLKEAISDLGWEIDMELSEAEA